MFSEERREGGVKGSGPVREYNDQMGYRWLSGEMERIKVVDFKASV